MTNVKPMDIQQLAHAREVSQKISKSLAETLATYIAPLGPLLSPDRLLGNHMDGFIGLPVRAAEQSFRDLESKITKLCKESLKIPFRMKDPIPTIKSKLMVYPWEEAYQLGDRSITLSSPVKWILAYDYPFTHSTLLRSSQAGKKPLAEEVGQFALNSVILNMALERNSGIKAILNDLRFAVSIEKSPISGDLPYIVLEASVEAFRPPDDLITTVVQLSGTPAFEELVDLDRVDSIEDPLVKLIKGLSAGE
jgi:hypothetical protein